MTKVITDEQNYYDIADAIRGKLGVETLYLPSEMAAAIETIETGTELTSEDEGKVVVEDAGSYVLAEQTSQTITQNGTYDTTTNNEVVVNVSGGGGSLAITGYYSNISSSSLYTGQAAERAIGTQFNNWCGFNSKAQHWWMIELNEPMQVNTVKFANFRTGSGTWYSDSVTFQGGDGTTWTDLLTVSGLEQSNEQREYTIQDPDEYTHYRFVCINTTSTSYYTGIGKIQLFT